MLELSAGPLKVLESLEGYRRHFTDVDYWRPYVQAVCARHFGQADVTVQATLPGSYPTFIAGWDLNQGRGVTRVIKFFGRLFEGGQSFKAELQVNRLLAGDPAIPAPAVLGSGELFASQEAPAGWPWPYLIYEYLPGVSIGEVFAQVSRDDRLACARQMGAITRRLHQLPLPDTPLFREGPEVFATLLARQRRDCTPQLGSAGALPPHLLDQVEAFLPPPERLLERQRPPHLIHADLTRDHLLGRLEGGRWTTLGLIDFGDAMIGSLPYELVALHLDLFAGDKRLLRAYFETYGVPVTARQAFGRQAMQMTLLHRFNVGCIERLLEVCPAARRAATLEEVTRLVWEVDAPKKVNPRISANGH